MIPTLQETAVLIRKRKISAFDPQGLSLGQMYDIVLGCFERHEHAKVAKAKIRAAKAAKPKSKPAKKLKPLVPIGIESLAAVDGDVPSAVANEPEEPQERELELGHTSKPERVAGDEKASADDPEPDAFELDAEMAEAEAAEQAEDAAFA
jgi:hypothetical protein